MAIALVANTAKGSTADAPLRSTPYGVVNDRDPRNVVRVETEACPAFVQTTMMRWGDAAVRLRYLDPEPWVPATIRTRGDRLIWAKPGVEVHQYPRPEMGELGGWEWETVWTAPPASNVIRLAADLINLEMCPEQWGTASPVTEGVRPLYHTSKGGFVDIAGQNYGCGKWGQVFRPLAVDAVGRETWCTLEIMPGMWTITVPPEWLREAVYPVTVDPTFGYTSAGASSQTLLNTFCTGRDSIAENGTGASISLRVGAAEDHSVKCNVYTDDTGEADVNVPLLTNGATEEKTVGLADNGTWATFNYTVGPSFVSGVFYRLAAWANTAGTITMRFDTSGGNNLYLRALTYGAWADPSGTLSRFASYRMSIYCTYTAGGGGASIVPILMRQYRARRN